MNLSPQHPTLVLIRGIPGSGKSYLAQALKRAIGEDNIVTLDPDATDYKSPEYTEMSDALTAEGVDAKLHPYRFLRGNAYKGIEAHKVVMWNQAFTNLDGFDKTIKNLQAYAEDHGTTLPVLVVEVEVAHDVAKKRVTDREQQGGHGVPDEAFARFLNEYTTFANEGYNVVVVNGEDDVEVSAKSVIHSLELLQK